MSLLADCIRKIVPATLRPIGYLVRKTHTCTGGRIYQGPFKGMKYAEDSFGSCLIPKLLGIYERELASAVEEACAASPRLIVDIGAAEGYYAVGLALRNPQARVVAFEMEEAGQKLLHKTIEMNAKQAAVEVRGKCEPADLQQLLDGAEQPLVVCDCEGYEQVLLDPQRIPALARAQVLVELHDFLVPGLTEQITQRFSASHDVQRIWQTDRSPSDYPFKSLYLRLLPGSYRRWAVSEWRPGRMSWLWMRPLSSRAGHPASSDGSAASTATAPMSTTPTAPGHDIAPA